MTMKDSKGLPKCLDNKERFGSRMNWGKNLEALGKSLQRWRGDREKEGESKEGSVGLA